MKKKLSSSVNQGFTFLEIIFTIVVIGILIAIISPSWLGFIARQQLRSSNNQIYWTMQNARSKARAERSSWQATFRINSAKNRIQYALHSAEIMPISLSESIWQDLPDGIEIDINESSLKVDPITNKKKMSSTGYYRAMFNHKGCPVSKAGNQCTNISGQGRITVKHKHLKHQRRCVIISTVIGALRTAEDASEASSNNKRCSRDD
jgi:prepilin-type N-terminal cleavage/methylation domain-containing protein